MFANTKAFSGFAVGDIDAAKKFYGETLGLSPAEQYGLLTLPLAGGPYIAWFKDPAPAARKARRLSGGARVR